MIFCTLNMRGWVGLESSSFEMAHRASTKSTGGREGGKKGGREGEREKGRKGGREGERERGREGEREEGRERGREGGSKYTCTNKKEHYMYM